MFISCREPRTGHITQNMSHQCWVEGKLSWPCDGAPPMAVGFLFTKTHCCLMFTLWTLRSFSEKPLPKQSAFSVWYMGYYSSPIIHGVIPPQGQDFPIPFDLHEISCLLMSPDCSCPSWMAAKPSGVSTTPLNFVWSAALPMVHFVLSSRPLMKLLNSIGASTGHWGTPLGAGFQVDFMLLITTFWAHKFTQSTSLASYLACTSLGCLCSGRQCQKP